MDLILAQRLHDGRLDEPCVLLVPQMVEHVDGRVQHGDRVSDVPPRDRGARVAGARLEDRVLKARGQGSDVAGAGATRAHVVPVVPAREQAGAADQAADDVGDDAAVEVGHDHHVELVRLGDELHAAVVDDHVGVLDVGVLFRDAPGGLQKETV